MKLNDKNAAKLAGIFILTAYGVLVGELTESRILIMLADVISGLSVIGIAVLLTSYFKPVNKNLAKIYIALRALEGISMVIGGFLYLIPSLQYTRDMIYDNIHIYFFVLGSFALYYLFYKSKLIPKYISVWGFVAILSLTLTTLLKALSINYPPTLDGLLVLIITNEVFLAFWLIIKGLDLKKSH